jgi:Fe-S-cluster containining protein
MSMTDQDHSGLRFSCTQCSLCCRFESGFVFLSRADLAALSAGLGISRKAVVDNYCRVVDLGGFRQLSLAEKENKDCVFWADGGCTVYGFRPLQCRSYPFWAHQLADQESWDRAAADCPGIGIGEEHSRAEIDRWVEDRRLAPPLNLDTLDLEDA